MPKTSKKHRRRNPAEIQTMVADFRRSGLSRREFSRSRGIPLSSLDYWLRRHAKVKANPVAAELVPVGVVAMGDPMIELELPGGVIIRIGRGVRTEDLRSVLEILQSC